jgi:hypothetical protein
VLQVMAGGCQPRQTVPTLCRRRGWVPGMAAKLLRRHSSRRTGVWGPGGRFLTGRFFIFYKQPKKTVARAIL